MKKFSKVVLKNNFTAKNVKDMIELGAKVLKEDCADVLSSFLGETCEFEVDGKKVKKAISSKFKDSVYVFFQGDKGKTPTVYAFDDLGCECVGGEDDEGLKKKLSNFYLAGMLETYPLVKAEFKQNKILALREECDALKNDATAIKAEIDAKCESLDALNSDIKEVKKQLAFEQKRYDELDFSKITQKDLLKAFCDGGASEKAKQNIEFLAITDDVVEMTDVNKKGENINVSMKLVPQKDGIFMGFKHFALPEVNGEKVDFHKEEPNASVYRFSKKGVEFFRGFNDEDLQKDLSEAFGDFCGLEKIESIGKGVDLLCEDAEKINEEVAELKEKVVDVMGAIRERETEIKRLDLEIHLFYNDGLEGAKSN